MRVAASYTRKSSESADRQTNSFERQAETIKLFCEDHQYAILYKFSDSKSGRTNERSGWKQLLKFLDLNPSHIAVMDSVSRMGRNQSVWADIEKRLTQFRFVQLGNMEPTMELVAALLTASVSESKQISYRVRTTHSLLKKKYGEDLRWGNPNIVSAGIVGSSNNSARAEDHWEDIFAVEVSLFATMPKWSQQKRIEQINFMGYKTRQGKPITRQNLNYAHRRYNTGGVKALKELTWPNTQ